MDKIENNARMYLHAHEHKRVNIHLTDVDSSRMASIIIFQTNKKMISMQILRALVI